MVPYWVVFCDIVCQVFLSLSPEYVKMVLSDSVSDPIKYDVYCSRCFCFAVPLTMLFASVLSVATGVGGCWWTISARAVLVEVDFWQFSNNLPSSYSVTYAVTFLWCCILHALVYSTGAYILLVCWILVLVKNILRLCFVPPVLICSMHGSICGESFRFFCILLFRMDVLRCNSETEWFVLRFQFSALSATPPGSLGPSTLWVIWL